MDYETIEDEVYDFVDDFFDDELCLLDANLDFIQNNKLIIPKVDYIYLNHFLSDILDTFKLLDPDFASTTTIKLNYDIINIEKVFDNFFKKANSVKEIFETEFIPNSPILSDYTKKILDIEKGKEKSSEDFIDIKHMKQNFLALKKIYYPVFETIFIQNTKEITKDFKTIINTKNFYLDRLIWKYASQSEDIIKHMKIRKMKGDLNAKSYLNFIMSIMRPYTDKYEYLQKCLRLYR